MLYKKLPCKPSISAYVSPKKRQSASRIATAQKEGGGVRQPRRTGEAKKKQEFRFRSSAPKSLLLGTSQGCLAGSLPTHGVELIHCVIMKCHLHRVIVQKKLIEPYETLESRIIPLKARSSLCSPVPLSAWQPIPAVGPRLETSWSVWRSQSTTGADLLPAN
jgi:hypothetical protein